MSKVKVAVVGNGNLGRWHCEKAELIKDLDFVALVDTSQEALERARALYPSIKLVDNVDEIVDEIDAAIIVTPISTHFELIKKFLNKGKHVFCEKSATESFDQIDEIKKILNASPDLVFQVGHSERYHQIWEDLKDYQSFFKNPDSFIRINRYGPYRGRDADVSVVEDLLIHDIDLVLNLFQEKPNDISATGYKIRSDRWDHVNVNLSYDSGRRVHISTGRNHVEVARNFEMINSEGCMQIDFLNNKFSFASSKAKLDQVCELRDYPKRDHLYLEQMDFCNAIALRCKAVIGIDAAYDAIEVLDRVLEKLK